MGSFNVQEYELRAAARRAALARRFKDFDAVKSDPNRVAILAEKWGVTPKKVLRFIDRWRL